MALKQSAGNVAGTLISIIRTRVELFSLEVVGERERFIRVLCMAFGALLLVLLALLVFSIGVVLFFWPTEGRYVAIGLLALVYALCGLGLFWRVWHVMATDPAPFSATLEELKRDVALVDSLKNTEGDKARLGGRHD